MKPRIYIETSVIDYLAGRRSRDFIVLARQQWSDMFWDAALANAQRFTSELTLSESSRGDSEVAARRRKFINECTMLDEPEGTLELASQLMAAKAVPETEPEDATHIAIATLAQMDYIASWNFSHLVGINPKKKLEQTLDRLGYKPPLLITPEIIIESGIV